MPKEIPAKMGCRCAQRIWHVMYDAYGDRWSEGCFLTPEMAEEFVASRDPKTYRIYELTLHEDCAYFEMVDGHA